MPSVAGYTLDVTTGKLSPAGRRMVNAGGTKQIGSPVPIPGEVKTTVIVDTLALVVSTATAYRAAIGAAGTVVLDTATIPLCLLAGVRVQHRALAHGRFAVDATWKLVPPLNWAP